MDYSCPKDRGQKALPEQSLILECDAECDLECDLECDAECDDAECGC